VSVCVRERDRESFLRTFDLTTEKKHLASALKNQSEKGKNVFTLSFFEKTKNRFYKF